MLDLARIPVHTTRLRLRGPQDVDLDGFAGMTANPQVAHLKGFEGGASREQCWAGLARILGGRGHVHLLALAPSCRH
jgi:hypothetical protein